MYTLWYSVHEDLLHLNATPCISRHRGVHTPLSKVCIMYVCMLLGNDPLTSYSAVDASEHEGLTSRHNTSRPEGGGPGGGYTLVW